MKYSSVYRKVPLFNVLQGHELFTRKHRSLWGLIPILHAAAPLRRMCSSALCRGHCFTTCFRRCLSGRWLVPPSLSFPVTSVPHLVLTQWHFTNCDTHPTEHHHERSILRVLRTSHMCTPMGESAGFSNTTRSADTSTLVSSFFPSVSKN